MKRVLGYMFPVAGRSKGACILYFNNFVVALAMRAVCVGPLAIFWVGIACLCCVGGTIFGELHSFESVVWNVRFGCRVAFAGTIRCYVSQNSTPVWCGRPGYPMYRGCMSLPYVLFKLRYALSSKYRLFFDMSSLLMSRYRWASHKFCCSSRVVFSGVKKFGLFVKDGIYIADRLFRHLLSLFGCHPTRGPYVRRASDGCMPTGVSFDG